MPGTIGIIQARMGSTRLPGKILAPLGARPLLEILVTRLATARVDEWWLATTSEPEDDVTEAWGHELGLAVYRGASDDVLSRFTAIIERRSPDWVVRVTADDPFVDAEIVDHLLGARDGLEDKQATILEVEEGLPLGFPVQLARAASIVRSSGEIPADQPHHRAHVLSWLVASGGGASVAIPPSWPRRPDWRWTVDTPDDLAMARSAFSAFGPRAASIRYAEMVDLLDQHPDITAMNSHVTQRVVEDG